MPDTQAAGVTPLDWSQTITWRGDKREWMHTQDYWREKDQIPTTDLDGGVFQYR